VHAIRPQTYTCDNRHAFYKLFAAYFHTVPLEELLGSVERTRRDAQLRYVVMYGAACSYFLSLLHIVTYLSNRSSCMAFPNKCAYRFAHGRKGEGCPEDPYENFKFCILHIPLPGEDDPNSKTILDAKRARQLDKIAASDFDFEGAQLAGSFDASGNEINDAHFEGATFHDNAWFQGAQFASSAWFYETKFRETTSFMGAVFSDNAMFLGATFSRGASFTGATFGGPQSIINFSGANFGGFTSFGDTIFVGKTAFNEAILDRGSFMGATFQKEVEARKTRFGDPIVQEQCCRAAKQACDKGGDRSNADYYFYREMGAKRKRKPRFWRWLELPAQ
jgi:uncharacterized protein YjbI with pentapeptide repeats